MKKITSSSNQEIKNIIKLHSTKGRQVFQKFIIEGVRSISTALQNLAQIDKLYLTEDKLELLSQLDQQFNINNSSIYTIPKYLMKKVSTLKNSSGILGVFNIPKSPDPIDLTSGIVLSEISDPGNMGTLIRTANACNIKSIVTINGTDPWGPKVVQASAGTITASKIFNWNWDTLIKFKKDLELYALVVNNGQSIKTLDQEKTAKKALIIIGNEAHGINKSWLKDCDKLITLPMPGHTESLNAAVAGSIAIYLTFVKV